MSVFSISSPPPRMLPLAPQPTPLSAPPQGSATSERALASGYAPAAPAPGNTAGTPAETDPGRSVRRPRDPALAGPPPAFQTNLLDLRNDLETLVRDMDAARAAEARILYGAPPPPRPLDPAPPGN